MPSQLNEIERRILDYMVQYLRDNTYQPSIREIGEEFGIKSTKTVSEHLQALAEKGFLERDPSRSRGVRILGVDLHAESVSIPCYGELPDGRGGPRGDGAEMHLTLDRRLAGGKGAFFLRVRGDALALLDVRDGDFLLLEPAVAGELAEGDVVVARRGGVPIYYRVSRNGRGLAARPIHDATEAVVVDPAEFDVVGRVTALYRRMAGAGALTSLTAH